MSLPPKLAALLAQVERRHWIGVGASVALHLAVVLGWRQNPPPEPEPVSFEIALQPPEALPRPQSKSRPTHAKAKPGKTPPKTERTPARKVAKPARTERHTLEARWRGESRPPKDAPPVDLPEARTLGITAPVAETPLPPSAATPASAEKASARAGEKSGLAAAPADQADAESGATRPQAAQLASHLAASDLAEPGVAEPAAASRPASGESAGISLSASPTLSPGAARVGATRGAQDSLHADGFTAAAVNGAHGPGGLSASQSGGAGLNLANGNGAQSRTSQAATALSGGENQGLRLTAAGILASRADLPAGRGSLAAGPETAEAGRAQASPLQAEGAASGKALSNARAGGAPASPQAGPGKHGSGTLAEQAGSQGGTARESPARLAQAGGATRETAPPGQAAAGARATASAPAPGSARPAREAPVQLAGSKAPAKTLTNGTGAEAGSPSARQAGAVLSDQPAGAGEGRGSGASQAAGNGRLNVASPGTGQIRIAASGSGPGTVQAGKTLALAPGEPGSSPRLAVTMEALVARPGPRSGGGHAAATGSLGSGTTGTGGAYPGASLAQTGGGQRDGGERQPLALTAGPGGSALRPQGLPAGGAGQPGSGTAGTATARAGEGGRQAAPAQLRAIKVADAQVIRKDTEARPLDVLAPSTFCPLPLPGHSIPDNRPPRPGADTSVPSYAPNNPSFVFPLQALLNQAQGTAIVRVEVLPDGRPGKMWLKQSSGNGLLDRDAQSQLAFWRFNPAIKNGQPVAAWIDVPVVYRLQDAKK